jgi:hypothetical protein
VHVRKQIIFFQAFNDPSQTVTAVPVIFTRPGTSSRSRTTPPRSDAWYAVKVSFSVSSARTGQDSTQQEPVLLLHDKSGLGKVHLPGNCLHPWGICRFPQQADTRRISRTDPVGKGIHAEKTVPE